MTNPALGVCYYPEHWPQDMWADDARRMAEAGISFVRIAEFAWSRIETARDVFDFDWLDMAIETLGVAGLKVVMCTPTATPPKWLVDEMPDMVAIDAEGRPRGFGSRRHYCFSHERYRKQCARITEILAKRYGDNPHVAAWQTDNEYGCHGTTISYSDSARDGFRDWLAQKYQSPDALNRAWGNVFWSMEVSDFSEIELPNLTVTEPNPAHVLDFRRYTSDQVVAFNRIQTNILRQYSPGRDIIHNFMGRVVDFDHFDVSADLDVASWDSYPIGNLERFGQDDAWKNWYMRAGDPDFQAFHHDLYRACGQIRGRDTQNPADLTQIRGVDAHQSGGDLRKNGGRLHKNGTSVHKSGRFWVMEQQPGPVNWAPWNPDPHPGMVRLWSHEAFAHGAEVVSYFRWRQPPFAQEQMHTALNRPDNSPDRGMVEATEVAGELASLPETETEQAAVALVFDYASLWATEIQPQGANYDGFKLIFEFYRTLRKLGQSVDILPPSASFAGYKFIAVPHLLMLDEKVVDRLKSSGAQLLFGPRAGSRTAEHQIPDTLPPGYIQKLLPIRVQRVESIRPGNQIGVGHTGAVHSWFEHLECGDGVHVLQEDKDGRPVCVSANGAHYIAGWPDENLLNEIVRNCLDAANIESFETGEDLRIRGRGSLRTIVNYGPREHDASHLIGKNDDVLVGSADMPVAGVTIVKRG